MGRSFVDSWNIVLLEWEGRDSHVFASEVNILLTFSRPFEQLWPPAARVLGGQTSTLSHPL